MPKVRTLKPLRLLLQTRLHPRKETEWEDWPVFCAAWMALLQALNKRQHRRERGLFLPWFLLFPVRRLLLSP
jgi:hypothetical protein